MELLGSLEQTKEVIACCEALAGEVEPIELGDASDLKPIREIYQGRERRAKKRGVVVPGGAELVRNLENSEEEKALFINFPNWFIVLEDTPEMKCLGCLQGGTSFVIKNTD